MTGIADLPTELLYIVAVELQTRTEMKVLRGVCQKLNSIIDPLLFASIAINTHPNALFCTTIPFCEALSSRRNDDGSNSSHLSMHVKKLKIIATNPGAPDWQLFLPVEMQWYRIFPHALSSLINLRSVHWTISKHLPTWMFFRVPEALSFLPLLAEFTLDGALDIHDSTSTAACPPYIALDSLGNLHSLVVRVTQFPDCYLDSCLFQPLSVALKNSRSIHRLEIEIPLNATSISCYSLDHLFRNATVGTMSSLGIIELKLRNVDLNIDSESIMHLHSLKSLDITFTEPCRSANLWRLLRDAKIHLKRLSYHGAVGPLLLNYVRSCPSLRILHLSGIAVSKHLDSDKLADAFYGSVLPMLSEALNELRVEPDLEGRWCFGYHNREIISKLSNLQRLEVSLLGEGVHESVTMAIECLDSLPRLEHLSISSANSSSSDAMRNYRFSVDKRIHAALESNRIPPADSLACTAETQYRLNPLSNGSCRFEITAGKKSGPYLCR